MSKNITDLTMNFIKSSNLTMEQVKNFRNFLLEYNKIKINETKEIMQEAMEQLKESKK